MILNDFLPDPAFRDFIQFYRIVHFGDTFLNFRIVFQPTGLFRLTGIPAYELNNQ